MDVTVNADLDWGNLYDWRLQDLPKIQFLIKISIFNIYHQIALYFPN